MDGSSFGFLINHLVFLIIWK